MSEFVQYRTGIEDDLATIEAIEQCGQLTPWTHQHFMDSLLQGHLIEVAILKEKVVGFIICRKVMAEAEIFNIGVHPDIQGRGIGRGLLIHALDQLKTLNIASVFLEVRASNVRAQRLYETSGFNEIAIRRDYYAIPHEKKKEDAIVMAMEIL